MIYCSAQEFNIFFAQIHEFNKDGHEPIHTELISHFPSLAKTHANHICPPKFLVFFAVSISTFSITTYWLLCRSSCFAFECSYSCSC